MPASPPRLTLYRGSRVVSGVVMAVAAGLMVLALLPARSALQEAGDWATAYGLFAFLSFFPALFFLIALSGIRQRLRIFDEGIEGRPFVGPTRFVRFDEATSMSWGTYIKTITHASAGTFVTGVVRGPSGRVTFEVPWPRDPNLLIWARDRCAEEIANRWQQALGRGERFAWGPVFLTANGLRLRPDDLLSYAIPYEETLESDRFVLRRTDRGEQVCAMPYRTENFNAGYMLFHRLTRSNEGPAR